MSNTNYPSANPTQEPQKDNRNVIYGVLITLLLATWGYLFYDKSQHKEIQTDLTTQLASATTAKDSLQLQFDALSARADSLTGQNNAITDQLAQSQSEIAQMKNEIRSILNKKNATAAELARAKTLIAELNSKFNGLEQEVTRLQGENAQLTKDKEELTSTNTELQSNLGAVTKEKENLADVGSTLHASNLRLLAINEKSSGKEKETAVAKRADKMRISFDLDENRIAPSGSKELYVVLTAPDGKPVAVEALGSGRFTTREEGEKIFTNKVTVNYTQGKSQNVSFDWKQNSDFQKGIYKIEVYQNGFKIGEGKTELKKGGLF